ncbi:MAG: peptide-methionine (S)-S-oxide reductase MsrA, partial [Bacillota bacterium]|nr:peptide-methionine (S)-S-oxide reductase MsrA [Bacillota bacterium]
MKENQRVIYLAGGCFWGVEGYLKKLHGVFETTAGYANGISDQTDYHRLHETDHAEAVKVEYDMSKISLEEILLHYFRIIDPKSVNQQGNDIGRQYRTGIYYENESDAAIVEKIMEFERQKHGELAVETGKLNNFVLAEEYHQDYLDKNPGGYCHINLAMADEPLFDAHVVLPTQEELKK